VEQHKPKYQERAFNHNQEGAHNYGDAATNPIQPHPGIRTLYPSQAYNLQPHIVVIQGEKQKTKRLWSQGSMLQL
jgi:hypothetical protein